MSAEPPKAEAVDIEIVRLPHGRDLPLPDYAAQAAAGADLLAAIEAEIELKPMERRIVHRLLPSQSQSDAQRNPRRVEKHRLDLRQPKRLGMRQPSAATLCPHTNQSGAA